MSLSKAKLKARAKKAAHTRKENAATEARFFRILKLVDEMSRKFPVPVLKKKRKKK